MRMVRFRQVAARIAAACGLVAVCVASASGFEPVAASPLPQDSSPGASLSPYWHFQIQQWEAQIVRYAELRRVDPDLVAALMWHESKGISWEVSASGAVGLMQIMSSDQGFVNRPDSQTLSRPSTNIFWGTTILTDIIRQANGDLFTALAAYNGGWYQTNTSIPRDYARQVLTYYAGAIAVRYGYEDPRVNEWGLIIEIQGRDDVDIGSAPQPGWLVTSHMPGPGGNLGRPVIGAVVYSAIAEDGSPWRTTLWLLPNE